MNSENTIKKIPLNWEEIKAEMAAKNAERSKETGAYTPLFLAAAVHASFSPEELKNALPDNSMSIADTAQELKKLLQSSEVVVDGKMLKWQLKPTERIQILKTMGHSLGKLNQYIPNQGETDDNVLQRVLNGYIAGTPKPLEQQNLAELGATFQVAGWLREVAPNSIPRQEDITATMGQKQLIAPFEKLAAFFQGREAELNQLKNHKKWPPLHLYGLGGSGKSTLISKFILDHLKGSAAGHIPFIYLDFDKPGISIKEPLTLLFEGLRQLRLQYPDQSNLLERYQIAWEKDLHDTEINTSIVQKGATRGGERRYYLRDFDTIWKSILNLNNTPLLFVLDSFEEVQYRASFTDIILLFDFLQEMLDIIPNIRVVISGRSELPKEVNATQLYIGPFDDSAALAFIVAKGITDATLAKLLFQKVGGIPLNLSLAIAIAIKELEAGNKSHDWLLYKTEGENIQEVLFRRNVEHIHNPDVRKLAFPGLVVRHISPAIIQHVLAEPCELVGVDTAKAFELFEELKKETFLVNIDETGRFRFRPDLRKQLIHFVDKQEPEKARKIHDLAIEFYKQDNTPQAKAEQVYHALRRGDAPESIAHLLTNDVRQYLETSLSELSPNSFIYVASLYNLEVPKAVRLSVDLKKWELKMASELENFLVYGQETAFNSMKKRLNEHTERNSGTPLRALEAKFYELAGDLTRTFELGKIAISDARKYLDFERQCDLSELLSRLMARRQDYKKALEYAEEGIKTAQTTKLPLHFISLTIVRCQLLKRLNRPAEEIAKVLEQSFRNSWGSNAIFNYLKSQKGASPSNYNKREVLAIFKNHFSRYFPVDYFPTKLDDFYIITNYETIIIEKLLPIWNRANDFEQNFNKLISQTGDLSKLDKLVKERINLFLREIVPPSVFEIAAYDVAIYAEKEGKLAVLVEEPKASGSPNFEGSPSPSEDKKDSTIGHTGSQTTSHSPQTDNGKIKIFISYAKEDTDMKIELDKHLVLLRRDTGVEFWDQSKIRPGEEFEKAIKSNLNAAHIILLLISADYLSNDDLYENEMQPSLQKRINEGASVVPIYLKPAIIENTPLSQIAGLPRNKQPVSSFKDRNSAYLEVAVELRRLLDRRIKA
ncbi:MAG: TIR domain-containing protein [Saprospiraceae bacterium]|nr:TIR domain-containing protein [Saprospiraceae bacterium]